MNHEAQFHATHMGITAEIGVMWTADSVFVRVGGGLAHASILLSASDAIRLADALNKAANHVVQSKEAA